MWLKNTCNNVTSYKTDNSEYIETTEKLDMLARSAQAIKQTTQKIKTMMVDDEALVADVDKGLVKN